MSLYNVEWKNVDLCHILTHVCPKLRLTYAAYASLLGLENISYSSSQTHHSKRLQPGLAPEALCHTTVRTMHARYGIGAWGRHWAVNAAAWPNM